MTNNIPVFVFFYVGSLLVLLSKGKIRNIFLTAIPVISFIFLITAQPGEYFNYSFLGFDLTLFRVDKLSLVFGYAFIIISLAIAFYGFHVKKNTEHFIGLIYAGSGLGAVFAGDLLTLYFFWEVMTIASTFLIWQGNFKESIGAGFRYFLFHLAGGLILLLGIILYINKTGNTEFSHMGWTDLPTGLIMIGFGVNAAWPFLHTWLTDSYPRGTFLGTVMLTVFTTKTAIYTLARGFAGEEILIVIGAIMTAFPIFYAVLENNMRKVLSYSLINQLGFMVAGIGVGTTLAINGAVGQAFVHIMFKSLLFMGMGAVLHQTGKINATELGGLYKYMPFTTAFTIVGSATISAFPLFSAFVTKSMILSSVAHEGFAIIWLTLLFASAGVLDHSGIKIPFFAFFSHDSGLKPKEAPWNMLVAMGFLAALNIFLGVYPAPLLSILPYETTYNAYTAGHVLFQYQLLFFSILAFTLLLRSGLYPAEIKAINLDFDYFYRKAGTLFMKFEDRYILPFFAFFKRLFFESIPELLHFLTKDPMQLLANIMEDEPSTTSDVKIQGWLIGWSVFIITIFLLIYLLTFMHF